MDKYMREELKDAGKLAFAIIVVPCFAAAILLGLLFLWVPYGAIIAALLVIVIIVGAVVGRIKDGAEQRRRWDK